MHKRIAPPRNHYLAILGVLLLTLAACLTGSVRRIALVAIGALTLDRALRRRFALFDRLGWLDRRGMHLIDPWPIGASLGMSREETERVLASLEAIGWVARLARESGERVTLTVSGLARR